MAILNTTIPETAQQPAAATAAVATLAAPASHLKWKIYSISWSYSAAPAAGATLVIAWTDDAGAHTITYYVTASGPGILNFIKPLILTAGKAATVTLASGAGTVVGNVYVDAAQEAA